MADTANNITDTVTLDKELLELSIAVFLLNSNKTVSLNGSSSMSSAILTLIFFRCLSLGCIFFETIFDFMV